MFRRQRQSEEPKVELTPMVDVVFLLLIFFMISTTFIETPGISIDLPESSATVVEKEPQELMVFISKDGEIRVDGKAFTLAQLQSFLLGEKGTAEGTTFVLNADQQVRHGLVVSVMDAAQQAGFTKLAIATERPVGENMKKQE
ncbi:MAG: biopolymer transporter ExbD [Desulfuromonas sp.]|nr:MAG: biopolymer transporter ExbD [Desulfuromonas sp.]